MKQITLSQSPIALELSGESPVCTVVVRSEDGVQLASFPVDLSLLAAVLKGFTYQVTLGAASVGVSYEMEMIVFRVEMSGQGPKKVKIDPESFSRFLGEFRQ